jgi:hypothetical protein
MTCTISVFDKLLQVFGITPFELRVSNIPDTITIGIKIDLLRSLSQILNTRVVLRIICLASLLSRSQFKFVYTFFTDGLQFWQASSPTCSLQPLPFSYLSLLLLLNKTSFDWIPYLWWQVWVSHHFLINFKFFLLLFRYSVLLFYHSSELPQNLFGSLPFINLLLNWL